MWSPPAPQGFVTYPPPIPPGEEYIVFDEYAIADPLNAAVDNEFVVMDEELDALEFGRVF
jgi:hypothetical protein